MADIEGVRHTYNLYVIYGSADATSLSNKNLAKLCVDCEILDEEVITSADVDAAFSKFKEKGKKTVGFEQFIRIMQELGKKKYGVEAANEIFDLIPGKKPLSPRAAKSSSSAVVRRLTDAAYYTGTHKQRFTGEGKGRGIEGREEKADYSGYVSGYKNQGSYRE